MKLDRPALNHLYRYCLALSGNSEDAYDLLQDAIEAYLRRSKENHIEQPQAYVKRIARNCFYDQARRKKIFQLEALENQNELPGIEQELEQTMIDDLFLKKVWQTLGPKEREVVFLWAVEGMTTAEIAREINVPLTTVLSRLHRLRIRVNANESFASNGGEHA